MLQSHYKFDQQIRLLQDILNNNIPLAEAANICLKTIPQTYLSKAVQELKQEYEEIYKKNNDEKDNDEKLTAIRTTLNLAAREHVTNIDELFVNLAEEINTYYNKKLLSAKKEMPYLKKCQICKQKVSNDNLGLKWHEQKCKRAQKEPEKSAPQRKNKKKQLDTKQRYQQRQNRLPNETQSRHHASSSSSEHKAKPLSKKQRLASKRYSKHQEKLKKYLSKEKLDSQGAEPESIFIDSQNSDLSIGKVGFEKKQQSGCKIKGEIKDDKAQADEEKIAQNEGQDYEFFS